MTTRIHDLLDLPAAVRKGDFVQDLTGGIANPERTVRDYAITPKILQTFGQALSIVGSALRDARSQAAYLHGSFGSGKSHFMAVVNLMLSDHPAPWRRPELHALRADHAWIGQAKLLQLPIHMLGAQDMESKILGTYVRWVAENHPEAPVPALFADQGLIEDARGLRATIGDDAFFGKLNSGIQQASSGWGTLAKARHWDAPAFEASAAASYSGNAKEDAASQRALLFSDLIRTFFKSWTAQQSRFLDLDDGLGVLSRHAHSLGYSAVLLYLDELVLWLAGNSSDLPFVGREIQKMVKLKEAQDAGRAIPIVSFVARQRDLSQFLGEQAQGAIRTELSRNLSHHDGRFETVTLSDSNLPAIVAHRVVRPKDEAAAQILADDFAQTWRAAGQAQSVLIGSEGDEADFRKVYPFSPALVEALVALSDCLQRERTAIRILMELLVHHLPDQTTGRVVPVGDAFDALAESEDPIDDPVMKARFDRARDLYLESFLPLIRRQHGTDAIGACQRSEESHDRRLGCSGCPNKACRNDNRLAKTVLMAALVPEAKPFKGLTAKRLVHLNHGTIASIVPGAEIQAVTQRLRDWASQVGALRVGDQKDPEISVHLAGVDLQPILAQAAEADTPGARKILVRKLLYEALGLQVEGTVVEDVATFHGTRRKGRVRYGNVREMDDQALTCPQDLEWQIVIDYPFDEKGHGPDEDLRRVEQFRDSRGPDASSNPTVVWLPTFFSHSLEEELGVLVALEHILDGQERKYLGHLRVEDQTSTRADLDSLRVQKKLLVERTLAQAYGLTMSGDTAMLDRSREVDEHLLPLLADLEIRSVLAGTLKDGYKQVIEALLYKRYPHLPKFTGVVSATRMERVQGLVEKLLDERDRRMNVDKTERAELQAISDPLGITDTRELVTLLNERPFQDIEQRRQQAGVDTPTVATVRKWLDPQKVCGLPPEVQDVLVSLYTTWSGRTFQRSGRTFPMPRPGQLPDDIELLRPELPAPAEWTAALERAGQLFAIAIGGRALGARNLATLSDKLRGEVAKCQEDADGLFASLEKRVRDWADPADAPRLTTARSASALVQALSAAGAGAPLVRELVRFNPETSGHAMERSLSTAAALRVLLDDEARWIVFRQVEALQGDPQRGHRAQILQDDLRALLSSDEINKMLSDGLADLMRRAGELLRVNTPPPPPPQEDIVIEESWELSDRSAAAEKLQALALRLDAGDGDTLRVRARVTAWRPKPTA